MCTRLPALLFQRWYEFSVPKSDMDSSRSFLGTVSKTVGPKTVRRVKAVQG